MKDPPVTRVGYAAYMAAVVNRTCGLTASRLNAFGGGTAYSGLRGLLASSVFKRGAGGRMTIDETALPHAWRARVRALCVGGSKTTEGHKEASKASKAHRGVKPNVGGREWAGRKTAVGRARGTGD